MQIWKRKDLMSLTLIFFDHCGNHDCISEAVLWRGNHKYQGGCQKVRVYLTFFFLFLSLINFQKLKWRTKKRNAGKKDTDEKFYKEKFDVFHFTWF